MTTVAAFIDSTGVVAIASDRALTGTVMSYRKKLFQVGEMAVSGTGLGILYHTLESLRAGDLATPPALRDAVFSAMKESGQAISGEADKSMNFCMLVVEPGQAPHRIGGDKSIYQCLDGYEAIGTGEAVATGVLYVARKNGWSAANAVRAAVKAAIRHDPWSGGEVDVIVFEKPEEP